MLKGTFSFLYLFVLKNWLFFPVLVIGIIILYPSIHLDFPAYSYVEFQWLVNHFNKKINISNLPINFYFTQYGTVFASIALAFELFEFNSRSYFILNLLLKLTASFTIFYFVSKWSSSKVVGVISSLFFVVSFPGIQNTTWVTLYLVYIAVIVMFIFIDRWRSFHSNPSMNLLWKSVILFTLTMFTYPFRMIGLPILIIVGEGYYFFNRHRNSLHKVLIFKHGLTLSVILSVMLFGTSILKRTEDLSGKMVSPDILFKAVLTGYPPIITTLWLFISNSIFSPKIVQYLSLQSKIFDFSSIYFATTLSLLGLIFLIICFLKRKFIISFLAITAVAFPILVFLSKVNLEQWQGIWVAMTQFGGTVFILSMLLMFLMWDKNRQLSEVGLLGGLLSVTSLIIPWAILPQSIYNDQSAFDFTHRYYTLPSIGIGMLLACVFGFFIDLIKNNLKQTLDVFKKLGFSFTATIKVLISSSVYLICPVIILSLISLNALSVNFYLRNYNLLEQNEDLYLAQADLNDINLNKINMLWEKLKLSFDHVDSSFEITVYIENVSGAEMSYIKAIFPLRIAIYYGYSTERLKAYFIFNKDEVVNIVKNINTTEKLYAFKFEDNVWLDIRERLLKEIGK